MEQSIVQEMERHLTPAEFRFVESKLYAYVDNKKLVEAWENTAKEIIHRSAYREPGMPGNRDTNTSPVESISMQVIMLEQKAFRERFWIKAIEDVLELLPEQDKRLVELKYFEQYLSNTGIADKLSISERQFYKCRERIVWRFANRFGLL